MLTCPNDCGAPSDYGAVAAAASSEMHDEAAVSSSSPPVAAGVTGDAGRKAPLAVVELKNCGQVLVEQAWGEQGALTGSAVWEAGVVLAHYLDAQHSRWRGLFAIELGAGLACTSIVAARCGCARVLATDGDKLVLPLARRNLARESSALRIDAAHLDWSDAASLDALLPDSERPPDLVLAADVVYGSQATWAALLGCVRDLCRRRRAAVAAAPWPRVARHDGGTSENDDPLVLLAHTERYGETDAFVEYAERRRFDAVRLPPEALAAEFRGNGRSMLFELRWRGDAQA